MDVTIRPLESSDIEDVVQLSLRAWAPVFASFERVLGTDIYLRIYPEWKTSQRAAVEDVCRDAKYSVWLAVLERTIAGFVAYSMNVEEKSGEVYMLAVDPDHQKQGIGTQLNMFALEKFKEHGMRLATVGTGGDPGHAPARAAYEKAGYTGLPLVHYYKAL
jgi:GNAT superfamily N-acetyltransferase